MVTSQELKNVAIVYLNNLTQSELKRINKFFFANLILYHLLFEFIIKAILIADLFFIYFEILRTF